MWFWIALLTAPKPAVDDVVFSAAPVAKRHGTYLKIGPAHLIRWSTNSHKTIPLTDGPYDDTDPQSVRGNLIAFWRRDRRDLIGHNWLCTIKPDGTDFKVVRRIAETELGQPRDVLDHVRILTDKQLPPRENSDPIAITRLQDGKYLYSLYAEASILRLATSKGKLIRDVKAKQHYRGELLDLDIMADSQWKDNPDGFKAFWYGGKRQILIQKVKRSEEGGQPTLYFLDSKTDLLKRTIKGHFIEDVDQPQRSFLTVSRTWADGLDTDSATSQQSLYLWSGAKQKLTTPGTTCLGACFIKPVPVTTASVPKVTGPSFPTSNRFGKDVIVAASVYGEKLGNVYRESPYHLYRMSLDGSQVKQLTSGSDDDELPLYDRKRNRIYFWRGTYEPRARYRLYSIAPDGTDLKYAGIAISFRPVNNLIQVVLNGYRRKIAGDGEARIAGWSKKPVFGYNGLEFGPSGRYAVASDPREYESIVDLKTGKQVAFDTRWHAAIWLDDKTLLAFHTAWDDSKKVKHNADVDCALINLSGKAFVHRTLTVEDEIDPYDIDLPGDILSASSEGAFRLDSNRILWAGHHHMSDGGYGFFDLIDLSRGRIRAIAEQSIEGVSDDRKLFIATKCDWVGGYKGVGSGKLETLYVWQTSGFKSHPIGFRRAYYSGACFVPLK